MANINKAHQKLESSNLDSETCIKNLNVETATLTSRNLETLNDRNCTQIQLHATQSQLSDTKSQRKNDAAAASAHIADLQKHNRNLEAQSTDLQEQKRRLETRHEDRSAQITLLEKKITSLLETQSQQENVSNTQIQDLRREIRSLEDRRSRNLLRGCCRMLQFSIWKSRCETLKTQVNTLSEQAARIQASWKDLESRLSSYEVSFFPPCSSESVRGRRNPRS